MKTRGAIVLGGILAVVVSATWAADNITGFIRIDPNITHSGTGTGSTLSETFNNVFRWAGTGAIGTNGSAAGMNKLVILTATISGGATQTWDLAGGVTNSFGQVLTFARVKMLVGTTSNSMTTAAQSILVQPAPANGWGSWLSTTQAAQRIYSGGGWAIMAPCTNAYAVTAGTGDLLDVINESTNAAQYWLYIGGE